jgi:hypothetical protein
MMAPRFEKILSGVLVLGRAGVESYVQVTRFQVPREGSRLLAFPVVTAATIQFGRIDIDFSSFSRVYEADDETVDFLAIARRQ